MAQATLAKEKKKTTHSTQQPPALPSLSARIYSVKIIIKTKQNKDKSQENLLQCLLLPEMLKHSLHFQDKWYEMKI